MSEQRTAYEIEIDRIEYDTGTAQEIEPTEGRDKKGRFAPGNRIARSRKQPDFKPALESLQRAFPSENIGEMMLDVYQEAMRVHSAKAALAVIELALAYQFGKPVARQISASMSMDEFRSIFSQEEGDAETMAGEG